MKKRKLMYNTALMLLLLSILLYACFKQKEILIDQETKGYCLFDENSYWIYQDSATLKMDSVVINKYIGYQYDADNNFNYETFFTLLAFYCQDSTFNVHFRLTTAYASKVKCVLEKNTDEFYYHSGEIEECFNYGYDLTLRMIKNNYLVNGIIFNNVKIFESSLPNKKEIYYWAKHVGLIRMEIYENDTVIVRNLIRYNVKPYKS